MKRLFLLLAVVGMIFTACEAGGGLDEGGNGGNGNGGGEVYDPNNPLSNQKCSNNELLYISKSCLPMELSTYDGWGAKLISNTYENGVGRLTFNGEVTTIPTMAFSGNELLEFFKMPNSVTSIGYKAFDNCKSLISVTIPDSVTSIGGWAFSECTSLTSVAIGNGVTSIGEYAFLVCDSLTRVDITDLSAWCKISFVGSAANPICYGAKLYLNGSELTDITIPDSVTSIGNYSFYGCSSLTSVTIPDSVTSIGDYAFYDCDGLTNITIPNSVTSIGDYAFYDCDGLTNITIPNSVTSIGSYAFNGCSLLTSVTIGNSVTSIGNYAFYECSGLTSVTIPDSVTSIGGSAFRYCNNLINVYCKPTTPPTASVDFWGDWFAFSSNASGRKIYVPRNSVSAYKAATSWKLYDSNIVGYDF